MAGFLSDCCFCSRLLCEETFKKCLSRFVGACVPRFGSSAVISNTMVPAEGTPEKERKEWENEPTDLDSMLSLYAVDAKFAGRTPGTTLYLTSAQRKDGVETNIQPDQSKKLFLAA